jgi:putative acetyltransferase
MKSRNQADEKLPQAEGLQGIAIRAARPEDAEQIAELHNLPGYRYGTLRVPFHTTSEIRAWLDSPAPGSKQLVANLDGRIIGDIGLNATSSARRRHVGTIGMGVHDDFVGRGVGAALMRTVIDMAENWLNLSRLELTVYTDNDKAIRLYEKCGFVKEGHLKQYAFRNGIYVDAYSMARLRR